MTRQVSLQEVLTNAMDYHLADIYTSIPGVVVGIHSDLSGMRVDVQPSVAMRNEDGDEVVDRPAIINVPLHMPVTQLGGLTYPIKKGNPVWLNFSMRGLDVWKKGRGESQAPSDLRRFDLSDCIAIPGVYPAGVPVNSPGSRSNSHSTEDVVLVHNIGTGNEVEIRLKPSGDVIINTPKNTIINAGDSTTINAANSATVNCTDAEVNSETFSVNSEDVDFQCDNFNIQTGTYTMNATEEATATGVMSHNGSFILNGTPVEDHDHGGIAPGGSRTNPFGT